MKTRPWENSSILHNVRKKLQNMHWQLIPKTLLKELFSKIRGWVRRGLLGRGTATVHPVATWMSPQSPLAILVQHWTTRTLKTCWR